MEMIVQEPGEKDSVVVHLRGDCDLYSAPRLKVAMLKKIEAGYSAEICRQFRSYPATCLLHADCCTGVYSAGRNGASLRLLALALKGPH
jgi:hypothetical protein